REALVWYQLRHPNILPFVGINEVSFYPRFCLISPWMANGSIMNYIAKNPTCDRLHCVFDVARGLEFLHGQDPPVVHGDIRGANILVTDKGTCCLADFGLSIVEEASSSVYASSDGIKGAIRWLPFNSTGESERRRPSRDIYSFGCTIIEVLPTSGVSFIALI
ncbi:kinase-like protein, partial [Cylindrobasidium torrendii FP15055 ss-10]